MNAHAIAQRAYARPDAPTRTPRGLEYDIIARVTHRLRDSAGQGARGHSALIRALHDNREVWTTLAVDVADDGNGLPKDLRARLFYLAEFTRHHTSRVMAGDADVVPLLEVNTAVLRGLRGGEAGR